MKEIWKPIKGYERIYEVSNTGKVRSLDRITVCKDGVVKKYKGCELVQVKVNNKNKPYLCVCLYKNREKKRVYVSRLVANAFLGEKEEMEVNHKDGNKNNNNLYNLEWVTHQENIDHATENHLIDANEVLLVNGNNGTELRFKSQREASRFLGFSENYISMKRKRGCTKVEYMGEVFTII